MVMVITGTLNQPKKKRASRKKSTPKKPSMVTPKKVETKPTLVDPTDNDSSNTPDMYKDLDGFDFDGDQDK